MRRNLTIMFAAVLLLAACQSRENQAIVKKSSSGKTCEVLLAADKTVYYGETQALIDSIFREIQPGLPQAEPRFDVVEHECRNERRRVDFGVRVGGGSLGLSVSLRHGRRGG